MKNRDLILDHLIVLKSSEENSIQRLYNENQIKKDFEDRVKKLD